MNAGRLSCAAPILFVAMHALGPAARPQTTNEPQTRQYQLKIEANKVLVPVVVTDRDGHPIGDLKQEDFQVFDEGKPRPISAFSIERGGTLAPGAQAGITSGASAANSPLRTSDGVVLPAHITVFLLDDLHLSFEDLPRVRAAVIAALPGTLIGTDMAAVVSISGTVNTGLTRDQEKLHEALAKVMPHGIYRTDKMDCPHLDYYEADLIENKHDPVAVQDANRKFASCNPAVGAPADLGGEANLPTAEHMVDAAARRVLTLGHLDVQATYAGIRNFVNRLAPLPGQRTLVLVSPGFLNVEQDALSAESQIVETAARANIVISALDARGLYATAFTASEGGISTSGQSLVVNSQYHAAAMRLDENPMADLANGTGGTFFHNNNDLNAGLKEMTEQPQYVYLLELSLDGVKQNNSYHRLKVKVNRDGVQIEARHGYFMAKPEKQGK
jgi:VWFA-related protein